MAILAVAAIPLMQMTNTSVQHARSLEARMLARSVAENVIAEALADPLQMPGGISAGTQTQMNRIYDWSLTTTPPEAGQLQRFDVTVSLQGQSQTLSEMTTLKFIPRPILPLALDETEVNEAREG
jgi:general secretion pathway protein I